MKVQDVKYKSVVEEILRPLSGVNDGDRLTLMTRNLGGSLAMRVKSLASSLKVGLMFSSIIQPE